MKRKRTVQKYSKFTRVTRNPRRTIGAVVFIVIFAGIGWYLLTRSFASSQAPYVVGTKIVAGNGQQLLLQGAQIETSFNVMNAWQKQRSSSLYPTNLANPSVFAAMSQQWHMNVLRLPISNWVYTWDNSSQGTRTYLTVLDQTIQQANQAGIYVVLDLHDDDRAGSPYADSGSNFRVATSEMVDFWKVIAARYKTNPMVFYDALNEPYDYPDWNTWYQGGPILDTSITPNKTIQAVGFQNLVDAIRSTGSQQIVMIEAWQKPSPGGAFNGLPAPNFIKDSTGNDVYSYHMYTTVTGDSTKWNSLWGPVLGKFPLYVGEWAYLPNAYTKTSFMCMDQQTNQVYSAAQATQGVTNFLNYLGQNHINWSAWQFDQYHLIQDETTFLPTVLSDAEKPYCGAGPSAAGDYGMGTLVKNYLIANSQSGGGGGTGGGGSSGGGSNNGGNTSSGGGTNSGSSGGASSGGTNTTSNSTHPASGGSSSSSGTLAYGNSTHNAVAVVSVHKLLLLVAAVVGAAAILISLLVGVLFYGNPLEILKRFVRQLSRIKRRLSAIHR